MQPNIEFDDAASSRVTGSARRRTAFACAVLFLTSLLALAISPATSAEPALPKVVGSLPRYGADIAAAIGVPNLKAATNPGNSRDGLALVYPKLDRLYQLYNLKGGTYDGDLILAERDLGSFALLRTLVIPDHHADIANHSDANAAEWVTSFDNKNDRLFIGYTPKGAIQDSVVSNLPGLLTLNLHDFTYSDSTFPNFTVGTGGLVMNMVGLEFDESTDTLLILQSATHGFSSLGNTVFLAGWKSEELLKGGRLPQVTPRLIRACRRDPLNDNSSRYMSPILVAQGPDLDGDGSMKSWVVVPCFSTNYSSNTVLVRMDRATALDPQSTQEKAVVAPPAVTNWAADSAHGRMYLLNDSSETDAWVYEVATNAFVGIVALSPKGLAQAKDMSLGVDEASGRLYARAGAYGLMITAAAQDPVPQADVFPSLAASGSYRLLVDAKRNRILSLPGVAGADTKNDYQVIAVPPPLPAPARENPDNRTAQVDEAPGKTVAQYGGNASAYGMRMLLSRGISGAIPSNGNGEIGQRYTQVNSYCGFADRELVLAQVSKTELSNNSRFARAAAVAPDNATVIDLAQPSRCDAYNSYSGYGAPLNSETVISKLVTTGLLSDLDNRGVPASKAINDNLAPRTTWDYEAADCSTPNGEDKAGPNSQPLVGDTAVKCTDENSISAKAQSRVKPLELADLSVGKASADTKLERDKAKGLVATSTSKLENINIAGISIGYIENSAVSFAKGRKGTAGTVFSKPRIGYVSGPGIPSCTDQCDIDAVIRNLNTALSGRAEFRRVNPEERLAKGSPGGYEAGILKSEKQQASDNSLTGDKSVEIPALEMVVYNDNPAIGRARQVFQFAGVRANSYYGIQLAGEGSGIGLGNIGDVVDGATGDLLEAAPALPNGGEALSVRLPIQHENPVRRAVRQTAAGVDYSLRIIFSNPREAAVMATVWLLILSPYAASRRRRSLKAVTTADPEGHLLP